MAEYETKVVTPSVTAVDPIDERRGKFRFHHGGRLHKFATRTAAQAAWNALNGVPVEEDEDGEV